MGLRERLRAFERPAAPERVTLAAIGWVRNGVRKPRPRGWERVESRIEVLPEHVERLRGLGEYSHVIVVFYLDLAADAPEQPATAPVEGVETGVFATRSQLRPNHLGVAAVRLLGVEGAMARGARARRHRGHARAGPEAVSAALRFAPRGHDCGGVARGRFTRRSHWGFMMGSVTTTVIEPHETLDRAIRLGDRAQRSPFGGPPHGRRAGDRPPST